MNNGCTDREQIADIARTELLAALDIPAIRAAVKMLICRMINEGDLCLPLPEALTFDCSNKTLTLTLSDEGSLSAELSCLPNCGDKS